MTDKKGRAMAGNITVTKAAPRPERKAPAPPEQTSDQADTTDEDK